MTIRRSFLLYLLLFPALNAQSQLIEAVIPLNDFDALVPTTTINGHRGFIVLLNGDTLKGGIRAWNDRVKLKELLKTRDVIYEDFYSPRNFTVKLGKKNKVDVGIDEIRQVVIQPGEVTEYGPVQDWNRPESEGSSINLTQLEKEPDGQEIIKQKLAELEAQYHDWIFFDVVVCDYKSSNGAKALSDNGGTLGKELKQLLNPGFSSKIKVYPSVYAVDIMTSETKVFGVESSKSRPDEVVISRDGGQLEILTAKGYQNTAKVDLYEGCEAIADRPKWKQLPADIFKHYRECVDQ